MMKEIVKLVKENILGTCSTVTSKEFLTEAILHIFENTWHREVRKDIK